MRIRVTKKFTCGFSRRVRRDWLPNRIVFTEGHLGVDAVNGRRRTKDKLADAVLAREFEEINRAVDIGFSVELGLAERRAHTRARGQVHDTVEASLFEELVECGAIANVCLGELVTLVFEVFANVLTFDLWFVEVVEVVNNSDLVNVRTQQPIYKM
jgi:hypothetical protein